MQNSTRKLKRIGNSIIQSRKNVDDFDEKIEIRERCKGVHCVDLGESFPTNIYLQKSASIQPRTSPSKFGGKSSSLFIRLLSDLEAEDRLERVVVLDLLDEVRLEPKDTIE